MSYHKNGKLLPSAGNSPKDGVYLIKKTSLSGSSETDICSSNENLSQEDRYVIQIRNKIRQEPQGQENHPNSTDSSYNTLIIHGSGDERRFSAGMPPFGYKYNSPVSSLLGSKDLSYRMYDPGVHEITNIPDDYLSQSQVLKHLAKEVKVPYNPNNPNCDKPVDNINLSSASVDEWNYEQNSLSQTYRSKSQPDLTRLSKTKCDNLPRHTLGNKRRNQRCIQLMEKLIQENNNLKLELEVCRQNSAKTEKLEQEVQKVHRAHVDLVDSCERRDRLERTARGKLQAEIRRLQDANHGLREQLEIVSKQLISARVSHTSDGPEVTRRDAIIAQLVAQNKELLATKDRQEIELSAQRVTLEEQRTHIDILDTALTNAQSNVVRLEEECRKKQLQVDRVAQLQRALSTLQLTSDRREQGERQLRLQLENELKMERARNNKTLQIPIPGDNVGENLAELKRKMREKDERIIRLESEVAKWEQRYLDESELRQAAIDAASIPKDAKIAALEKTSQESEKRIAEARTDKLRQMDEVHAAQKKVTDLESRTKELESKLAERDAMIRVLQKKHTYKKEVSTSAYRNKEEATSSYRNKEEATTSYPSMSLSHHTPHSSLNMADLSSADIGGPASTTSVLSTASSVLTSSTVFDSNTSYAGSIASNIHQRNSTSSTPSIDVKSLNDHLKDLDSQLLSKRGLCCFPGFSHPAIMSRKGRTPQPLLASVAAANLPLFEPGSFLQGLVSHSTAVASGNRPDDMLLLEKQGLCSQAQRQQDIIRGGSLPPSSLPRPRKHRKLSATPKFGEYGRLSDSEIPHQKSINSSVDSINVVGKSSRETTPKKLGEYTRLDERSKTPNLPNEKIRESSIPLARRYGEYCRIAESEKTSLIARNENERCPSVNRESPRRYLQPGFEYSSGGRKSGGESTPSKPRESPGRSMFLRWGEYNKLKIAENERKLSTNSTSSTEGVVKPRSSPMRSLIPSAKRGEYSFTPSTGASVTVNADHKIGPNVESKLRIFSPGGVPGRRGSLQRECHTKKEVTEGVRSLPTPNKYRIHF